MAGARIELDNQAVLNALRRAGRTLANPRLLHADMGEYLLRAHRARFDAQQSPEGTPWAPLSPRYKARKKKNKDKILMLDGYLSGTLRYQPEADGLLFGSNRPYAALMHFGGEIQRGTGTANYPARPFLGTSEADDTELLAILQRQMDRDLTA